VRVKRFGPFTAEGGLVLALVAVIAGGTLVVDSISPDSKPQTRTVYGTPTVRVHDIGTGGIQPGDVQPRAIIPVVAASAGTVPGTAVVTAVPKPTVAPKKKAKKVAVPTTPTTAQPVVTADPNPVTEPDPGGGQPTPCLLGPLCPAAPAAPPAASKGGDQPASAAKSDADKATGKTDAGSAEPAAASAKAPAPNTTAPPKP
jgi:hypothetical protein